MEDDEFHASPVLRKLNVTRLLLKCLVFCNFVKHQQSGTSSIGHNVITTLRFSAQIRSKELNYNMESQEL